MLCYVMLCYGGAVVDTKPNGRPSTIGKKEHSVLIRKKIYTYTSEEKTSTSHTVRQDLHDLPPFLTRKVPRKLPS